MDIGAIWNVAILSPVINAVVWLSHVLFGSFGLTIIALTIVIRALMWPLTAKQLHASRKMQEMQPKLAAIQKKHGADRQKLAEEQMKLYRESGVSPAGCLIPTLIQLPIWLALYQAIIRVLAVTPEDFLSLSGHLYSWPVLYQTLPLSSHFFWLDLSRPDLLLTLLVGGSMWLQQKMSTPPSIDPKQAAQSQLMTVMMPLMFMFISFSLPSGLALYWVVSTVIGAVMQYFITGWGSLAPTIDRLAGLLNRDSALQKRVAAVERKPEKAAASPENKPAQLVEGTTGEAAINERPDRGGSQNARSKGTKRKQRGSGGGRSKRR